MFTGIIQDIGSIKLIDNGIYQILTNLDLTNCIEGSSIACNGVCLTARNIKKISNRKFSFEVNIGEETLSRSNLGQIIENDKKINLEKSLRIGDEIGGHFVYGHVDTITEVTSIIKLDNSWEYCFNKNFNKNNKFVVEKGSISVNGISLTVANVNNSSFMISVIDHTYNNTNLKFLNINDKVNVEYDYLARFLLNEK